MRYLILDVKSVGGAERRWREWKIYTVDAITTYLTLVIQNQTVPSRSRKRERENKWGPLYRLAWHSSILLRTRTSIAVCVTGRDDGVAVVRLRAVYLAGLLGHRSQEFLRRLVRWLQRCQPFLQTYFILQQIYKFRKLARWSLNSVMLRAKTKFVLSMC